MPCFDPLKIIHIYTIGDGAAPVGDGDLELVMPVSDSKAMQASQ
jgi:hypothetical protein